MYARIAAGSLLAGLLAAASPAGAQNVAAEVVFGGGPVAGHVVVGDGYSTYRRPPVIVHRYPVARRVVVVERYAPRIIVIERVHRYGSARAWARHGYRPVTLFYRDGRYYDRWADGWPRAREVVVYERDGRFYDPECHGHGEDHHRHHEHWDD